MAAANTSAVFLDYDQSALDQQYDQRTLVPDPSRYSDAWRARTEIAQATLSCRLDVAYGDGQAERFDLYGTDLGNAPLIVFIHGGAWRGGTKEDAGCLSLDYVPKGIAFAAVEFNVAPDVTLGHMVEQARNAVAFIHGNAENLGIDPTRIYAMGISSGAHMAAMVAVTDWQTGHGLPVDVIKGLTVASGPYDLEPVILSARNDYLNLTPEDAPNLSPKNFLGRLTGPTIVGWGGGELKEFQRQGQAFAEQIEEAGKPVRVHTFGNRNHFEMHEEMGRSGGGLFEDTLSYIAPAA